MDVGKRQIRVLQVIGNLSKGGAESQLRLLLELLNPERFESSVMYFHEGPDGGIPAHVNKVFVPRGPKLNLAKLFLRIDRIIRANDFDLVHVWLPEVITVPAAWSAYFRGIPVVSSHRGTMCFGGGWLKSVRDNLNYLQHLPARKLLANFDIKCEPAGFRYLFRLKQGEVIANGLDLEALDRLESRTLPNRSQIRLIYAGRISPEKGLQSAFDAVSLLRQEGKDVHFSLFGDGHPPYLERMKRYVDGLSLGAHVTFFGVCKEWQAYAGDAHALVFPSKGEGTSNVVLEALAMGLPVIISDIAMARQLFRDRENALIVPSNKGCDWAQVIESLIQDLELHAHLARRGQEMAQSFCSRSMALLHEKVYESLAAETKRCA